MQHDPHSQRADEDCKQIMRNATCGADSFHLGWSRACMMRKCASQRRLVCRTRASKGLSRRAGGTCVTQVRCGHVHAYLEHSRSAAQQPGRMYLSPKRSQPRLHSRSCAAVQDPRFQRALEEGRQSMRDATPGPPTQPSWLEQGRQPAQQPQPGLGASWGPGTPGFPLPQPEGLHGQGPANQNHSRELP